MKYPQAVDILDGETPAIFLSAQFLAFFSPASLSSIRHLFMTDDLMTTQ
jgi:hypothetical protein